MKSDDNARNNAVNPENYGYATGRIRALEAGLLSSADLSRVFDARQPEDISRVIQDKGYKSGDVEAALRDKMTETYEVMQQIIPDAAFVEALILFNDTHNLKVVLKHLSAWWIKKVEDTDQQVNIPESDGALTWHGLESAFRIPAIVEPEVLFRAIRDRNETVIPEWLWQLAEEGTAAWLRSYDTGSMDMVVDKGAWIRAMELTRMLNNQFFSGYMKLKQNLISLEILLRCRSLKTGREYLKQALPPVSSLTADEWMDAYEADSQDLLALVADKMNIGKWFSDARSILETYGKPGTAAAYNRIADQILADWLRGAAYVLRGPEVPVSYLLRRELEIKNIRIALTCLRNGVSAAQARELARAAV